MTALVAYRAAARRTSHGSEWRSRWHCDRCRAEAVAVRWGIEYDPPLPEVWIEAMTPDGDVVHVATLLVLGDGEAA